jgi:hypothetical protein
MIVPAEIEFPDAVRKVDLGFDDHSDICLYPKNLLPSSFDWSQVVPVTDAIPLKGIVGSATKLGTTVLNVTMGGVEWDIRFMIVDTPNVPYPLIGINFQTYVKCSMDWDARGFRLRLTNTCWPRWLTPRSRYERPSPERYEPNTESASREWFWKELRMASTSLRESSPLRESSRWQRS